MNLGIILGLGARMVLGGLPGDGTPSLILDFVPIADPAYGKSLDLNFLASEYEVNATDPKAPDAIINLQVWE